MAHTIQGSHAAPVALQKLIANLDSLIKWLLVCVNYTFVMGTARNAACAKLRRLNFCRNVKPQIRLNQPVVFHPIDITLIALRPVPPAKPAHIAFVSNLLITLEITAIVRILVELYLQPLPFLQVRQERSQVALQRVEHVHLDIPLIGHAHIDALTDDAPRDITKDQEIIDQITIWYVHIHS